MTDLVKNRYAAVLISEVRQSNINGDPDRDGAPRIDDDTEHGIITDGCIKRKSRNYVMLAKENKAPYGVYYGHNVVLSEAHVSAVDQAKSSKKDLEGADLVNAARGIICKDNWDVRTFGATLAGTPNLGAIRGPVQVVYSDSVEPIMSVRHTITRMSATNASEDKDDKTMGARWLVPHAVYRTHMFVTPADAKKTGMSADDLDLLWQSLVDMWEHDRSSSRPDISTRHLIVFKDTSESLIGTPGVHLARLADAVHVDRVTEGPARKWEDYRVWIDASQVPDGVEVIYKFGGSLQAPDAEAA